MVSINNFTNGHYRFSDMNKLKKINIAQFYIQLITAVLFAYLAVRDADVIKMFIAVFLITQWTLGYWRHRIVRRRLRK